MLTLGKDSIVFVGHSMGGLVIKRAYIIAKQKREFQGLADRVKTIMFLEMLGHVVAILEASTARDRHSSSKYFEILHQGHGRISNQRSLSSWVRVG